MERILFDNVVIKPYKSFVKENYMDTPAETYIEYLEGINIDTLEDIRGGDKFDFLLPILDTVEQLQPYIDNIFIRYPSYLLSGTTTYKRGKIIENNDRYIDELLRYPEEIERVKKILMEIVETNCSKCPKYYFSDINIKSFIQTSYYYLATIGISHPEMINHKDMMKYLLLSGDVLLANDLRTKIFEEEYIKQYGDDYDEETFLNTMQIIQNVLTI